MQADTNRSIGLHAIWGLAAESDGDAIDRGKRAGVGSAAVFAASKLPAGSGVSGGDKKTKVRLNMDD